MNILFSSQVPLWVSDPPPGSASEHCCNTSITVVSGKCPSQRQHLCPYVLVYCVRPPPPPKNKNKTKTHPRTHPPTIVQNDKEKKKSRPAEEQKPKNKHQVKYLPWFMLISRAHSWVLSLNLNIRPCMHHYILIRILLSSNEPILFIPFPKNWPAIKLTLNTH